MELYRKKVNINKPNRKGKDKSLNSRNDQKNIYIVYMCNNENILIKTDKVLGGDSNE